MAIIKTYVARPGSHLSNPEAQRVGKFLDETFGDEVFTPEQVVEAARPKESEIHGLFTWDKGEAARQWNLYEARRIVGCVMLIEERKDESVIARAFHHVVERHFPGKKSGYTSERVVWEREDFSNQVIERAKRELKAWEARYSSYSELREWAIEELASGTIVAEEV